MGTTNQKNGPPDNGKTVCVFVTAPPRTDLSVIRKVLEGEGVRVTSDQDVELGRTIRESLLDGLKRADAVIAVVGDPPNPNVFYEIGIADGLQKRVLLISPNVLSLVLEITSHRNIRASLDDEEALRFGISHFLRAPHHSAKSEREVQTTTSPLGERANDFLAQLRSTPHITEDVLVDIIAEAIRESGVETQAKMTVRDRGSADIAVWSDDLTALAGNPLPIEVRLSLQAERDTERAASQLMRAVAAAQVRWGLILFLRANRNALRALTNYPSILAMSVEGFLEGLRHQSFAKLLTDLRNRAVHGGASDA